MGHTWIIDVLADLRFFAQANDLPHLADELARTARVAAADIALAQGGGGDSHADTGLPRTGRA